MGYFELAAGDGLQTSRKHGRLAVVLAAAVFALEFVKIEKVSVGGWEVIVREPYALRGAVGLVLVYLLLTGIRSYLMMWLSLAVTDPEWQAQGTAAWEKKKPLSYVVAVVILGTHAVEAILVCMAVWLCIDDMTRLMTAVVKLILA